MVTSMWLSAGKGENLQLRRWELWFDLPLAEHSSWIHSAMLRLWLIWGRVSIFMLSWTKATSKVSISMARMSASVWQGYQHQHGKDISILYTDFTLADRLSTGRRLVGWSEQPTSQDQAWILPQPSIKIDPIIRFSLCPHFHICEPFQHGTHLHF